MNVLYDTIEAIKSKEQVEAMFNDFINKTIP